jgi:hypothetical protein
VSGSIALALKTDFDSKIYRNVLIQSLIGAIVGGLPGVIYVFATNSSRMEFGVGLIQVGSLVGGIACGLAAMSASVVAAIKHRGSGPTTSKAKRLQEYLNPDALPAIPPPTKPLTSDRAAPIGTDKTEIIQRSVDPPPAPKAEPTEPSDSVQPAFEDFDQLVK